ALNSGCAQDRAGSGMRGIVLPWFACPNGWTRGTVEIDESSWTSIIHPRTLRSCNTSVGIGLRDDLCSLEGFFPRRVRSARTFTEQGSRVASAARPFSVSSYRLPHPPH